MRRQLDTSSLSPSKSKEKAPIANASGENARRERLRRRTASSILASSLCSIARMSAPMRVAREAERGLALSCRKLSCLLEK